MLFLPEAGQQRGQPEPRQPGQLVDPGVAVRAQRDQLGRLLAAAPPVVDVGPGRARAAGGTVVAVAGEDGQAQAAEAAAGVGLLLAAAAAEGSLRGRRRDKRGLFAGERACSPFSVL